MSDIGVLVARPGETEIDVLAIGVHEPGDALPDVASALDSRLNGRLTELVADGEISGRLDTATLVHGRADGAKRVALAGIGPPESVDEDAVRTAAAAVARLAKDFGGTVGWALDGSLPLAAAEQVRAVVEGVVL